jgi:hypothetical protein
LSRTTLRTAILGAFLAATTTMALAAGVSSQFSLTGALTTPATFDLAALQALPATTQTVSFFGGGSSQTHTYAGTSLWGLVNSSGIMTDPAVKNDILNRYVLATGSDGYRVVYSDGELNPNFGNRPDLVAYAETIGGTSQLLGADGFARTTAPGDVNGGRYVSNLVNLDVRISASTQSGTHGGVSTQFAVSGAVGHVVTFNNLTDWSALGLTPVTQTVTFLSGSTPQTHTYTGFSLWGLLNSSAVGLITDPSVKNDILSRYVVATGSDGYKALFSMGELDPGFGGNPTSFIALSETVGGVSSPLTADGFARIVVPGDARGGRYVPNLTSLEVFSAAPVPEPRTWGLMGFGLIALGFLRRRRIGAHGA